MQKCRHAAEELGNAVCGHAQFRQPLLDKFVGHQAGRVTGTVDCADDTPGAVLDRHGKGRDAVIKLVYGNGISLCADIREDIPQLCLVGQGVVRQFCRFEFTKITFEVLLRQGGQKNTPHRRRKCWIGDPVLAVRRTPRLSEIWAT